MSQPLDESYFQSLLKELTSLPKETEWAEFKSNSIRAEDLGEYISALANSAALLGKTNAYMVWGVDDESHSINGTTFKPSSERHKQQELESWLLQNLEPKIDFNFYEFLSQEQKPVVILEIPAAQHTPVRFLGIEYIRIGSYKKPLGKHAEKERALWRVFDRKPWEFRIAKERCDADEVLQLIDYPSVFSLLSQPLPDGKTAILQYLAKERIVEKNDAGNWNITNLGAILFARELEAFRHLSRKAIRLIQYSGNNRYKTIKEQVGHKGYAVGFEGLIDYINNLLPTNEVIGKAFRSEVRMYPELSIRELVANALIHQDFNISGTSPMLELFDGRMEICNPGQPLVEIDRLLDSPPRSRNEGIASLMRRMKICEERGSGIDKVVIETEIYQLPAPHFEVYQDHTKVTLFAHRDFKDMDSEEKVRAAYLHCVLKYLDKSPMNNTTLRERFGVDEKNSAMISRIIKQAVQDNRIKPYDPNVGTKAMRYIPIWA
ncbi:MULTISPECIES: ATP-binding protein [Klebsiella]|nr:MULTISPECIES: ATP-binding protein [Klebsiella]MBU9718727.1 putative DNA binding domain-containing protein [Klebsiella pneumoniae subsp. ozaenae]MCP5607090.1 putative DNA binding domain-containing protein [Klebsiella pneumoniae]MCP6384167.1 putative DNA binding domain-containing protein [Klebsiella pneumoniae]RLO17587.1 transcriptional regulator [Klebsiella pneumoniae]STS00261.1 transcriptional regulator [Klebsiella pneumoniae]